MSKYNKVLLSIILLILIFPDLGSAPNGQSLLNCQLKCNEKWAPFDTVLQGICFNICMNLCNIEFG